MDSEVSPTGPSSTGGVLVASTGEPFERPVLERAIEVARKSRAPVRVISIARVYGTALGLQHPGLFPSKREWEAQADLVGDAVKTLQRAGLDAKGRVVGTRNPGKAILQEATKTGCQAIVMGARPTSRFLTLLGMNDVDLVSRRALVPVHVVPLPAATRNRKA
jgi:nucleotide-binding universal stress UspA family protein